MIQLADESERDGGDTAAVTRRYDFRMTPYLENLLRGRSADDPLTLQFLPRPEELKIADYENADPIGDQAFSPVEGIVHRYPDRVLLKAAHACPVYCRFCFRRDMVGHNGRALRDHELDAAIDYVREHTEIWEVILTGGDPLILSERRLAEILGRLASIDHLSVLRIHSRAPIVAPQSVDGGILSALQQRLPVYLAVHVNHPDELTAAAVTALQRLLQSGVMLLSQTVLLKGVNDDAQVLETLFRRLVQLKVRPYYLHHPDLARGTAHFRVPIEVGQAIMRTLRGRLSGLCQPQYMLDIPGGFGKVPIGPAYLGDQSAAGSRQILDPHGRWHCYPE